jgi:uncharacterized protein YdgA (DUF945 family)
MSPAGTDEEIMKRKLIAASGLLAILLAAYAGSSFYAGIRLQSETERAVEMLNTHLSRKWSDQVQISQSSYTRGVFSSEATYILNFPSSKDPSIRPEIIFTNEIQHGPFPFKELLRGNLSPLMASMRTVLQPNPYTQAAFGASGGQSFIEGRTTINMQGVSTLNWTARALDYTQEATRSKFGGATLQATIGADFSSTLGTLKIESLNISDGKSSINMQGGTIQTNTHIGAFDLNIGTSQASIDRLSIARLDQPTLLIEKINSQLQLNEKASLLDGQVSYELGSIKLDQKDWGKISLSAFYDQLDGTALISLIDLNNSLLTRSLNNAPEADLITTADLKQFWLGVQSLLKSHPRFRIDPVIWTTPQGVSRFNLSTEFEPVSAPANGMGLAKNPLTSMTAQLEVSRPMLSALIAQSLQATGMSAAQSKVQTDKDIKAMFELAANLKIGKMEGENFVSTLTFEKETFEAGGHTISMDALKRYISSSIPAAWMMEETTTAPDRPDETAEIKHLDPSALTTILTAADFHFEETRDEQGDPLLKVSPGNSGAAKIDMSFIGCGTDTTCEDVLLRATYSPDKPVALKVANDWNIRNRWARAYVNDKNEAVIEMDINAYGGIGHDALEAMVNTFFKIVGDFSKELKTAQ